MLKSKIGAGGFALITDINKLVLYTAFPNTNDFHQTLIGFIRKYVHRDNEGETKFYCRILVNTAVPFVAGIHDQQSQLAANVGLPDTEDISESLWVKADANTLEFATGILQIKNGGVQRYKIASDALGPGTTLVSGRVEADPDQSTVTFSGTKLRVKKLGITAAELGDQSVNKNKLNADVAGGGISGGAGSALAVQVDGTTIDFTGGGDIEVKDDGISTAKVVDGAITPAKKSTRTFTILLRITEANAGADNEFFVEDNFQINSIDWSVEEAVSGGNFDILLTVNGVADNTLTIPNATAQNATGSWTGMSAVPLPVSGGSPNSVKLNNGGAAANGTLLLSIRCEWT